MILIYALMAMYMVAAIIEGAEAAWKKHKDRKEVREYYKLKASYDKFMDEYREKGLI